MSDVIENHGETVNRREIKSYVLRAGRMTPGQQRGWDEGWPKFGLGREQGVLTPDVVFGRNAPLVLEIGYGMGQSLITMAGEEPDKDFVGIEVHRPGVGSLLNETQKKGLTNLRTYCDDAVKVLEECIPDKTLSRVQIYFPDPWHKKRHHKRRLIQPGFIEKIYPKLKPGGIIHMATDWENYAEQMMEVMSVDSRFENKAGKYTFSERPDFRPMTKFERRGQRLGHGVWDLLFVKM